MIEFVDCSPQIVEILTFFGEDHPFPKLIIWAMYLQVLVFFNGGIIAKQEVVLIFLAWQFWWFYTGKLYGTWNWPSLT
jgi:hypothetical protein